MNATDVISSIALNVDVASGASCRGLGRAGDGRRHAVLKHSSDNAVERRSRGCVANTAIDVETSFIAALDVVSTARAARRQSSTAIDVATQSCNDRRHTCLVRQ